MQPFEEHLLLLLRSALSEVEVSIGAEVDLSLVHALACKQGVEPVIYGPLLAVPGLSDQLRNLMQERNYRWIRTIATREYHSERIYAALQEAGVRYMRLKGAVFSSYYPSASMRTSSDLDLLYDGKQVSRDALTQVLQAVGATKWEHGKEHSRFWFDSFLVELHPVLFAANEVFYPYFEQVWERAMPQDDGSYVMCKEDLYLYHLAHMVKHMLVGGIGIRALCDLFLFLRAEKFDRGYVDKALRQLRILNFAQNMETLAAQCFSAEGVLSVQQEKWLSYFLCGDMYGSKSNRNILIGRAPCDDRGRVKIGYYWRRLFPAYRHMKWLYPVLEKAPILLPFCYVWRLFFAILFGRKKVASEVRRIQSKERIETEKILAIYREMGIEMSLLIK